MAALVQSFPQQSSTVTMLQTRPTSSSGPFQTVNQNQRGTSPMSRNMVGTGANATAYRGYNTVGPVAPYAFTTTPSHTNSNPQRQHPTTTPHLRQENRTSSAPSVPTSQSSTLTTSSAKQDDSSYIPSRRPDSTIDLTLTDPRLMGRDGPKSSPDRYRRVHRRSETSSGALGSSTTGGSAMPSGSGMATVGHLYTHPSQSLSSPAFISPGNANKVVNKDDGAMNRQSEQAKRYRRRSISNLGNEDSPNQTTEVKMQQAPMGTRSYAAVASGSYAPEKKEVAAFQTPLAPGSSHGRTGSDNSIKSFGSANRPSSAKREMSGMGAGSVNPTALHAAPSPKHEAKPANIPPRGSSDANKRITNPSPLSKPMAGTSGSSGTQQSFASLVQSKSSQPTAPITSPAVAKIPESPAAQHLAALNKKDGKKEGKSSRLRRAFSFGSAAELRKASAENSHNTNVAAGRARLQKDRFGDDDEAREAAIVERQEASGLGEGIYSGQGHFFTGSTDNLSISSTASSASVMLRKMGKGMKKSTRSLVGLFRPKSVIGVPAADAAVPEASTAQVSMVTVEAEREKVNVNVNPHDQPGGGTGFPKLERNSLDTASLANSEPSLSFSDKSSDNARPRRSIVGGEKERAEVLAAVKKGILKRSGTDSGNSSPLARPVDAKSSDFVLPQLPRFNDTPHSSAPSTPVDDHTPRGHRRTDSVTIEGEDYFMSVARFAASDTRSLPGTPRSLTARNISFSPRIQFHDTWPSGEYDRRGEIATCNRLTPTLAQAIKEELNTFKMEMEVHEQSKVYTHFF